MDARGDLAVLPDPHPTHIQDDAVEVREEVLTDVDIVSIITPKRWLYRALLAESPEQVF